MIFEEVLPPAQLFTRVSFSSHPIYLQKPYRVRGESSGYWRITPWPLMGPACHSAVWPWASGSQSFYCRSRLHTHCCADPRQHSSTVPSLALRQLPQGHGAALAIPAAELRWLYHLLGPNPTAHPLDKELVRKPLRGLSLLQWTSGHHPEEAYWHGRHVHSSTREDPTIRTRCAIAILISCWIPAREEMEAEGWVHQPQTSSSAHWREAAGSPTGWGSAEETRQLLLTPASAPGKSPWWWGSGCPEAPHLGVWSISPEVVLLPPELPETIERNKGGWRREEPERGRQVQYRGRGGADSLKKSFEKH